VVWCGVVWAAPNPRTPASSRTPVGATPRCVRCATKTPPAKLRFLSIKLRFLSIKLRFLSVEPLCAPALYPWTAPGLLLWSRGDTAGTARVVSAPTRMTEWYPSVRVSVVSGNQVKCCAPCLRCSERPRSHSHNTACWAVGGVTPGSNTGSLPLNRSGNPGANVSHREGGGA
jgi:hypothetical protein